MTVRERSVWGGAGGPKGVHVFVRVKKAAAALAMGSFAVAGRALGLINSCTTTRA